MPIRLAALLLLLVPTFAFAQFQETVEVNYIEVPVTVIGRDTAPIRNLTKANFEVYSDGDKRGIESFDAIDFSSPGTLKAISPLNPASRRNFLILFDLSFSKPSSVGRAQEAARDFINRSVGRRDLVGIAVIDDLRGFRFLTSFTTDRDLLLAATKDPQNFRAADPLQIASTDFDALFSAGQAGDANSRMAQSERGNIAEEVIADLKRSVAAADDAYRRARVQNQVEILGKLARSLKQLAGRKHIVLLSEGFDARLVQGRSVSESMEQTDENQAVAHGEIWKVDSDKRFGHPGAQRAIQEMSEEFRRADVVLHSLDIQGVRVQNDVRGGSKVNSNEGLFLLSNSTGGTVFRNSNDISADFERLARQHEVVYVLGFRTPSGKAGQFHNLKVKLVNVPGGHVQHRGGFYSSGDESSVERSLSTAEIILNDIPQNDIDMAALVAAFPTSGSGDAQVPVILEIAGKDLIAAAKDNVATTDIFLYAFDEEGIVRDTVFKRVVFETDKAGDRLRATGVKFYAALRLAPGRYAVKSLVSVVETGKRSFRRVDVEVPSTADVAMLQPLFFAKDEEWVMVKAESKKATTAAPYPFVLDGKSFIPAARPTLKKGESGLFTVWVWNAHADELTWEIEPKAKLVSETRVEESDMTKFVFSLERVPAGSQELGVTIRKKGSTDERRVSVPIVIR